MSADSDHQNKSTELLPNENENIFVLHVWPGEWDLPSLDPECLTAMVKLGFIFEFREFRFLFLFS